ncbi:chemotaxis protein CheB [Actinokineospora enzanensis]|uniref:chemotaxis protein CheB n=1 Tax=Actinokineospora enzanensis TaxID=155975 RepID=UPI000364BB2A|nr:chemotaxis protein CheB [Actinokineospora enzanensis]
MARPVRDLIVVGASAGGVEALGSLVSGLPAGLPAAVAVVLHMPARGSSALPRILDRLGPLPAVAARSGTPVRPGRVYAARPDHHLLVADDRFILSRGPTENGYRPSVDALFRSAAVAAGSRVVGVLLSGVLDDGVAGLVAIRRRGGLVLVQDPADALHPGMPENALRHVPTAVVLPAAEMGRWLAKEIEQPALVEASAVSATLVRENEIAGSESGDGGAGEVTIGMASSYSCPDCRSVLNEVEPGSMRYRCQVGHGWTAEALAVAQGGTLERALWMALRTLEDRSRLSRRMARAAEERGDERSARRHHDLVEESVTAAATLRRFLTSIARDAR